MKTATAKTQLVSVVIPAYNEELTIRNCLKSLAEGSYKKIEVILIDDFSNDKTASVAKEIAKKLKVDLTVIRNNIHKERGISRNLGAKTAKGNSILFIDADMQLGKNVIGDCVDLMERYPDAKAIIIPERSFGEGFWSKCRSLEKRCYLGDDRIEAARFFEKKAFWAVGGWDEKMVSGEDWDLTKRLKERYKILRIGAKIFHNEGKLTLRKVFKKKFYYALKSGIYLRKYPLNLTDLIFFVFRPAYIRNWKLVLSDPACGLGMFFMKGVELMAGGAGFLVSKLPNRY